MEIGEAVAVLRRHNIWRRAGYADYQATPREIWIALDVVLDYVDLVLTDDGR